MSWKPESGVHGATSEAAYPMEAPAGTWHHGFTEIGGRFTFMALSREPGIGPQYLQVQFSSNLAGLTSHGFLPPCGA